MLLSHIDCFFLICKDQAYVMFFPRYSIALTMTACFAVVMKFLWKYMSMHVSDIFMCEKSNLYVTKYSILIFYINTFSEKSNSLNLVLIMVAHESDWLVCCRKSRDSLDSQNSLDHFPGLPRLLPDRLPGLLPWTQWKVCIMSRETLKNVQGSRGTRQCPGVQGH